MSAAAHTSPSTGAGRAAEREGDLAAALAHFQAALAVQPNSPPCLLDASRVLLSLGRFDEAEPLLRKVLELMPRQPRALRGLARIARHRGDHFGAAELLRTAVDAAPAEVSLRLDLADALAAAGQRAAAEAAYEAARALAPEDGRIVHALARLRAPVAALPAKTPSARKREADAEREEGLKLEGSGDLAGAIARLDTALSADPGNVAIGLDRARVLLALGRPAEAAVQFEAVLARAPHEPRAVLGLAQAARLRGDAEGAIARLQAAIAERDCGPHVTSGLVQLLADLGRLEEAREACDAGLARHPGDAKLLLLRGRIARRLGDGAGAIRHLRMAAASGADRQTIAVELGRALLEAGAPEEALEVALAAAPSGLLTLARTARRSGHAATARALLDRAVAAASGDRGVLVAAAGELQEIGEAGAAVALLQDLAHIAPDDAAVWLQLGLALRAVRKRGALDAVEAFRRAAACDPKANAPLVEEARELLALGRFAEAETALCRALELAPDAPATLRAAVPLLRAAGETEAALAVTTRVAETPALRAWAEGERVTLLARLGRWTEAHAALEKMEERDGPRAAYAATRAHLLDRRGFGEQALQVLGTAREAWPRDERLWWQQMSTWIRYGELAQAEVALTDPPEFARAAAAKLAALRGRLAEAKWQVEDAATFYQEAAGLDPDDVAVRERLARMFLFLNQPIEAMRTLRERTRLVAAAELLAGRMARPWRSLLGRLTNEYLLDRDLLAALKDAEAVRGEDRIGRLREIARNWPEHTAVAINLLLELRRQGMLPGRSGAASVNESPIPWRVTQYWDSSDPPEDVRELTASWTALNPGFAYVRFDIASAKEYLRAHYPREVETAFRRAEGAAQKADIFRLAVLAREGGFYADADDRCVAALTKLMTPGAHCILYQEEMATVANSFIGAIPQHPVVVEALHRAVEAVNRSDRGSPWLDTGPALISRCLVGRLVASDASPADALRGFVVPAHMEMRRLVAFGCGAGYKSSDRYWHHAHRNSRRGRLSGKMRALLGLGDAMTGI